MREARGRRQAFEVVRTSGVGQQGLTDPKGAQLKRGADEGVEVGSRMNDPGARDRGTM